MKRTIFCTALMVGIAGFTITTTPAALAQTFDKNWTGLAGNGNWFTNGNWLENAYPVAGDTVRIDGSDGVALDINIEDADAECESIVMDHANILLKGRKLTLGLTGAATSNDITFGQILFFEDNANGRSAQLVLRNWVTFTGGGRLFASKDYNDNHPGYIERANWQADGGIKTLDDFDVEGHFVLYVSVYHDGDFFGVQKPATMIFGNDADPFDPELEISGAALNDETFTCNAGTMKFYQMKFAATAPKWYVYGYYIGGAYTGTIFATGQHNNVPNDIDMGRYSLLEVRDDQTFNGKLHMHSSDTKVLVHDGKLVSFEARAVTQTASPAAPLGAAGGRCHGDGLASPCRLRPAAPRAPRAAPAPAQAPASSNPPRASRPPAGGHSISRSLHLSISRSLDLSMLPKYNS